jgi:indolepyruvate decarboxylase
MVLYGIVRVLLMARNSIGEYLIQVLLNRGVRHVFGVPGDYVLGFYDLLSRSNLTIVNTCDEQGAGFAADAYARLHGLGAVCVTYGVGGLKVANTTAQAYAEKSPVVVISGAPGVAEREKDPLLHHKVRDFDTQKKVFEQITAAAVSLDREGFAAEEIDRAISSAVLSSRPVYIELPRDMIHKKAWANSRPAQAPLTKKSDNSVVSEAVREARDMINASKAPVIIAGVEIHRYGLGHKLIQFVDRTAIPVATTILSKSVVDGLHPLYLGVYAGAIGQESVRDYVESSDCLIILGALMTDIDLGVFTAKLNRDETIDASNEGVSIRHHRYSDVSMQDFLDALSKADVHARKHEKKSIPHFIPRTISHARPGKKITTKFVFERLNSLLTDKMLVLADVGDALFAGTDLLIVGNTEFISPAYYASLGFAVPASLGAKLAKPDMRSVVVVGDGAFQMTGMELSTALRYHINPIVIVLNNSGYLTERLMIDGKFNDLQRWDYSKIPFIIGGGKGYLVETEDQFDRAMHAAMRYIEEFSILEVRLDANDKSPALKRLAERLAGRIKSAS